MGDDLEEENRKLRAQIEELEDTIIAMTNYCTDALDALRAAERARVDGLRSAARAAP